MGGKDVIWGGIPVIMTARRLHEYINLKSNLKPRYYSETNEMKCKQLETYRVALMDNVEYVELKNHYWENDKCPFDAQDLAQYMLHLYDDE